MIPSALKTLPAYVVSPEWDDKRLVALPTTERQDGTSVAYARNARRKVRIEESLHTQLSLGRILVPDVKTLWSHFQTALAQQNAQCPERDAEWDSEELTDLRTKRTRQERNLQSTRNEITYGEKALKEAKRQQKWRKGPCGLQALNPVPPTDEELDALFADEDADDGIQQDAPAASSAALGQVAPPAEGEPAPVTRGGRKDNTLELHIDEDDLLAEDHEL
eukprot:g18696.t1